MAYAPGAVERAMKVQEVIVQAIAGKLTWIQAAEILGCSARTIRRYRWRLERDGYDGLFDRRRRLPSPKRAPLAELQRVLALYRDRYRVRTSCGRHAALRGFPPSLQFFLAADSDVARGVFRRLVAAGLPLQLHQQCSNVSLLVG